VCKGYVAGVATYIVCGVGRRCSRQEGQGPGQLFRQRMFSTCGQVTVSSRDVVTNVNVELIPRLSESGIRSPKDPGMGNGQALRQTGFAGGQNGSPRGTKVPEERRYCSVEMW